MANRVINPQDVADYMDLDWSVLTVQQQNKLVRMADGAAGLLGKVTGREFYPTPALVNGVDTAPSVTRTYAARGRRRIRIRDLRAVDSVLLDGVALTNVYSYDLGPGLEDEPATWLDLNQLSPYIAVRPYYTSTLAITGRWGFLVTPPEIWDAAAQMCAKAWKKAQANWADQMATPDGAMFAYFNALPEQVKLAVQQYRPLQLAVV